MEIPESELIKGCIRKDIYYQEQLYKLFAGKMFGVCLSYIKDYDTAKDILQEGFIKIFDNIGSFVEGKSLETWIKSVFVHLAIDHYRRNIRLYKVTSEIFAEDRDEIANDGLARLDEFYLLEMIRELPQGYRTVLNLYAVEGYSHKEIAELLNISEGTSRSQLYWAKKYLQKKLRKDHDLELANSLDGERIFKAI